MITKTKNKQIILFILGFWSSCEANFSNFDTHTAQLKTPTDRRKARLLFTKLGGYDSRITQENINSYLLGDFNIDLLGVNNSDIPGEFLDIIYSSFFKPLIGKPTESQQTQLH